MGKDKDKDKDKRPPCTLCGGSGRVAGLKCRWCGGSGKEPS
jgi:DnaJ-class molecular chaperone